ncbi:hypothetical protein DY000_02063174 [Brassica cretica]|uniref:TCP domain-containing protein n=1 Tax=Brassica cretica TaxID=69181 RepID=A0ABQ7AUK4_BRACR|nr:hypothetical protein DY000_02063174 [Brassica cretica]
MTDEESNHNHSMHSPSSPHPLGMRHQSVFSTAAEHGGCVEIVEVEGGPRDRRVRLSSPTAIQFYDVQDRLGLDRPSKAVDWLIKKAKSAIDNLAELPPWNLADTIREETEHHHLSFLPASLSSGAPPPHYHQPPSRGDTQRQDLRLSLHSFQNGPAFADETEHALFSGQSNPLVFDSSTASWDQSQRNHHQSPEFGKMQRLVTWNNGGAADSAAFGGGGFVFASPATTTSFQTQSQFLSQRGPLQSINTHTNASCLV